MKSAKPLLRLDGHQILAISALSALLVCYAGLLLGWGFFFNFFVSFSVGFAIWLVLGMLFFDHSAEYESIGNHMALYESLSFEDREIDEIYTSRFLNRDLFVASYRTRLIRSIFFGLLWSGYAVFTIYLLATGRSLSEMVFLFSLFLFTWLLATLRMKSLFYPILRKFQLIVEKDGSRSSGANSQSSSPTTSASCSQGNSGSGRS